MAGATGLEPATTRSTVWDSNQLSYAPALIYQSGQKSFEKWRERRDSNPQQPDRQSGTLTS